MQVGWPWAPPSLNSSSASTTARIPSAGPRSRVCRPGQEQGIAGNIAFLAGHGTLRKRVMGWQRGAPAPEGAGPDACFLRQTLEEGAFGLSTGLEYPPGSYATHAEIAPLVAEVAAVGGRTRRTCGTRVTTSPRP